MEDPCPSLQCSGMVAIHIPYTHQHRARELLWARDAQLGDIWLVAPALSYACLGEHHSATGLTDSHLGTMPPPASAR